MKTFKQYITEGKINKQTGHEKRSDCMKWSKLEKMIQTDAEDKDDKNKLKGSWKKYYKKVDGFKVYLVDGRWVNVNLSAIFGHGGHGYVHEFIPMDEIWISTHHSPRCSCKNVSKDRKVSEEYMESCIVHEITEFKEMKKGIPYSKAHAKANKAEMELGLLKMPNEEVDNK